MHKKIYELLNELNIPVAYNHFNVEQNVTPPFVVYRESSTETFKADGKVYYRPTSFEIELITEKKDIVLEQTIEELLTKNNIPYDITDEVWDEDEKIYHNFYEI